MPPKRPCNPERLLSERSEMLEMPPETIPTAFGRMTPAKTKMPAALQANALLLPGSFLQFGRFFDQRHCFRLLHRLHLITHQAT